MSAQYVFIGEHPTFKTNGEYKHITDTVQIQVLVSQDKDGVPLDMPYYTNMMYSTPEEFAQDWMPLEEWKELHPDEEPIPIDTEDDPDPVEEMEKEQVGVAHDPIIVEEASEIEPDFMVIEPDSITPEPQVETVVETIEFVPSNQNEVLEVESVEASTGGETEEATNDSSETA